MSPGELAASLDEALTRNAHKAGKDLGWVFVARTTRGLCVRPRVLEHLATGEKVYGLTVAQVRKLRRSLDEGWKP